MATAQQSLTLKGTIEGNAPSMIRIAYMGAGDKLIKDSSRVDHGQFVFHEVLSEPAMIYLSGDMKSQSMEDPNYVDFFVEPGEMSVALKVGDFKNAVITGSPTQDDYHALEAAKKPILKEEEPLEKAYDAAGKAYMKAVKDKADEATQDTLKYRAAALHDQFDPFRERIAVIDYAFFETHPQSFVTAYMLRFYTGSLPLDSLQRYYDRLGSVLQQSSMGKNLQGEIAQLRAGSPGSPAKDFTATGLDGNPVSLSTFRGKYVLLDFWASWCVPCRQSMPHVKELYALYKDKGLIVVGVSDDDSNPAAWRKAVDKDGTGVWYNVLRGLDMAKRRQGLANENDISDKFGIHSLPTKILVDPSGVIVGRYDKGTEAEAAAMDQKLAEAFGGKVVN